MTIRHFRIFIAVYETESTTQAAKVLHLAQPSVSLAIRELEEYYHIKLFDRIAKRLHITESGKMFYNHVVHIVDSIDDLEEKTLNFDSYGLIKVGASITIGRIYIPSYLKKYKKKYPHAPVYSTIRNSQSIKQMILSNDLDLAFIEDNVSNNQIISIPFIDDELILICSKDHPLSKNRSVTVNELSSYDFVLREPGSASREIFSNATMLHDVSITPIVESASNHALIEMVKYNLGLSVLPKRLVEKELLFGTIYQVRINELNMKRKFSVIYHASKFITTGMINFVNLNCGFKLSTP